MIYAEDLIKSYKKDKQVRYTGSKDINIIYYTSDDSSSDNEFKEIIKKQLKKTSKHKYNSKK